MTTRLLSRLLICILLALTGVAGLFAEDLNLIAILTSVMLIAIAAFLGRVFILDDRIHRDDQELIKSLKDTIIKAERGFNKAGHEGLRSRLNDQH